MIEPLKDKRNVSESFIVDLSQQLGQLSELGISLPTLAKKMAIFLPKLVSLSLLLKGQWIYNSHDRRLIRGTLS